MAFSVINSMMLWGEFMPDYKEMYLKMFRASEQAINILVAVQRECEELYISQPEPELKVIPLPPENNKDVNEK